jgi:thiosulfate dehydrogenase [quinone] large subunit
MAVHGLHAGGLFHRSHRAMPAVKDTAATAVGAREISIAALRIGTGFVFLWAFLDKTFGLGSMPLS